MHYDYFCFRIDQVLCTDGYATSFSIHFHNRFLEKDCGEQLTASLDKESNEEMKSIMQKLIANVQVSVVIE